MPSATESDEFGIEVRLDELLAGHDPGRAREAGRDHCVNLSILENGRARAIRYSTLAALCEVLQCQPGDLLRYGTK